MSESDLEKYQTVDEGIENRIKKYILNAKDLNDLILKIKTKRYTYNKLSRMFTHILCNFTKEEAKQYNNISYIRILGFNDYGKFYLNKIKKKIDIPIISKITKNKDPMLEFELSTIIIREEII